ncbi:hypothetical protein NliqN6_0755 [Naganishia liquefaciens]|uniref:Uncharacterized protein n=1 Tax=Naganishia liquefaciens TaxID=104408 RepID=A0A8H3YCN0_9TREE|nr:hypothetical protein NliqN6_0755 [Naganishia liquefaciens]
MASPHPTTYSPAGLSPGLPQALGSSARGSATPGTPSIHGLPSTAATRPGVSSSSHLKPASSAAIRIAPSTHAGSARGAGSVAATSVYPHSANPQDFEKALDEFVERQLPELERLLGDVVGGIDGAFDQRVSSASTERQFQQLQATLQHLITSTRQTGLAGIPITHDTLVTPATSQPARPALSQIADRVERATEHCYAQRETVRDGARAVCEIMRGAGK